MFEEYDDSNRSRRSRVYRIIAILGAVIATAAAVLTIVEVFTTLGLFSFFSSVLLEHSISVSLIIGFIAVAIFAYFVSKRIGKSREKFYDEASLRYRNAERLLLMAQNIQALEDAAAEFREALSLFQRSNKPSFLFSQPYKIKMIALCRRGLCLIEEKKENDEGKKAELEAALRLLEEAAVMYERKRDDARNAAQCYRLMGQLNRKEKNSRISESCFLKALQLFQRDSQYWETASCYKEIAGLSEDLDEKEENIVRAAEEYENDRNLWESAIAYRHLGYLFRVNNQLDKACEYFMKAAERFSKDIYFWEAGEALTTAAKILKEQNKHSKARESLLRAAKCFEKAEYQHEKQRVIREADKLKSRKA